VRDRERGIAQLRGRHDPRDESGAFGFLDVHGAPGEAQVHRLGFADGAGEALGSADSGDDAEFDFRLTEFRGVGGDEDVAVHRELAAAAECISGYCGDHRGAHVRQPVPCREPVVQVDIHVGLRRDFLDVGAGSECLVGAGDHDGADVWIAIEFGQRGDCFGHECGVQRIERVRPVQRQYRDALDSLQRDRLVFVVGHHFSSFTVCGTTFRAHIVRARDRGAGA